MARKFASVVLSLGCLNASSALALGLGDLKLDSYLNEPLRAEVNLLNTGNLHEDQIRIRLATREDFEKMGVDRAYFLTSIRFDVQIDGSGRGRIIVTSEDPVLEPYLDFIVEARWPSGRLLREYTVLIDPPVFDPSAQVVSASERVIEVEGEQMLPSDLGKKKTETAVQRTGTHVDVRDSDLPPGQMPSRNFGSDASDVPVPGGRYMIRRDETLWEIARDARPEGASIHQTMLEIQRLNPRAFIDGNINRIKAGYVIYLPAASDISSGDQAQAVATVRQQNEDWRAAKSSGAYDFGPSLRITADEEEQGDTADDAGAAGEDVGSGQRQVGATDSALEDLEKTELERAELEQRVLSMEEQVETLQKIVNLKDEQIAALQNALAESGQGEAAAALEGLASLDTEESTSEEAAEDEAAYAEGMTEESAMSDDVDMADEAAPDAAIEDATVSDDETVAAASVAEADQAPSAEEVAPQQAAPAPEPVTARAQAAPEQGGLMSYLFYGLGALVLAILAFVFLRRRGGDSEEAAAEVVSEDVFADVELKDQALEVSEPAVEPVDDLAADLAAAGLEEEEQVEELEEPEPERGTRGYGERKHDEYASDVDAGDALAEADIYIAYGRYPQAVDLLKNASAAEPGNSAYVLKLLEIHAELSDRDGVMEQLARLEKIGDATALARAEEVLAGMEAKVSVSTAGEGLAPAIEEELAAVQEPSLEEAPLESDFSELEIEEPGERLADDLDLSADFDAGAAQEPRQEEELVIATESNGMSTKLDLARAYIDMGDEDGARQILEEVIAEASDDLKAEARALLDRIG
jgi:pilus assembly protein FimV